MGKKYGSRWETVESAGEGGAGLIYKVKDVTGKCAGLHALKRLKNVNRIERFEDEISALQKLDHSGIPKIIDYSLGNDPYPYFVTEFIKGKTFADLPKQPLLDALHLTNDLAHAVAYANSMGVVHRDLKPENIMLDNNGKVIVLDFGICYLADNEGRLTETHEQMGSRFFMAPEMGGGRASEVTYKVDTYAIAKILYFLLTGAKIDRESTDGENDLKKITNNHQADYITKKILNPALVVDPKTRCNTKQIIAAIKTIKTLVLENFYPGIIGSKCRFCGEGSYIDNENYISTELKQRGSQLYTPDFHLLMVECDKCSNLQWFKHMRE